MECEPLPLAAVAGGGGIARKSERCHRSGERRPKWSVSGENDAGSARSGAREKGGHDFVMAWDDLKKIGHHTFSYKLSLQVGRMSSKRNLKDQPREHDAVHVRDVQRARHMRGNPGCFISVYYETDNGHHGGFVRRFVVRRSLLRGVAM